MRRIAVCAPRVHGCGADGSGGILGHVGVAGLAVCRAELVFSDPDQLRSAAVRRRVPRSREGRRRRPRAWRTWAARALRTRRECRRPRGRRRLGRQRPRRQRWSSLARTSHVGPPSRTCGLGRIRQPQPPPGTAVDGYPPARASRSVTNARSDLTHTPACLPLVAECWVTLSRPYQAPLSRACPWIGGKPSVPRAGGTGSLALRHAVRGPAGS